MPTTAPSPAIVARVARVARVALVGAGRLVVGDDEVIRIARRNDLVMGNLGLVEWVVRRHCGRGIDREDLVQRGNLGLIRAAELYDPGRGYAFSTYATWWIRRHVHLEVEELTRSVRLPSHACEAWHKYLKAEGRLIAAGVPEPAVEDVLDAMGVAAKKRPLLREIVAASRVEVMTATSLKVDGDDVPWDFATIDERDGPMPEEGTRPDRLPEFLGRLDDRHRLALTLRYGLDGGRPMTLVDVGRELGVTKTRADQLIGMALARLRVMYKIIPDTPGKSRLKQRIDGDAARRDDDPDD